MIDNPKIKNKRVLKVFLTYCNAIAKNNIPLNIKQKNFVNGVILKYNKGNATESEVIDANLIMGPALRQSQLKNGLNDIVMGDCINDGSGNSTSLLKRVVIVLDDSGHIQFVKSGDANHSILAGKKYFGLPTRHSFWFGFENQNLVLHPAASEDKSRLEAWETLFKNGNLKTEIREFINSFS